MKNVIILGAGGGIAKKVTELLVANRDVNLTLFLRSKNRLSKSEGTKANIIEGDVLNYNQLRAAISGQDIVYVNLAGDLENMGTNIVKAMTETGVKKIIAISSIGIYETPLKAVLKPYRKLADIIEASELDYTIIRPTWFTNVNEVDYEITYKGEAEKGSVISQKSLAAFITKVIENPEDYTRSNLGINKPNS
ncbi:NAD(P)H-binding protein [Mucilaginibacter dorajii]|uniref:SDR family oxidoreductase n=1 Tax=Mucilaginibacter dorajii TaxID=692994 RepID=A0ABP7Q1Q6_9SPHI|nr:NAD(P)H-binding protein [Mucilaginibacter dorajii]MCS3732837.1 uncharacterized protein YbjT (DUF2867 family) [Mucilaginibacter dorajii]